MIKINISNRAAYTIIAVFLVLVVSGIGYAALGSVPNPGHSIAQLQTCGEGETLKVAGGVWTCVASSGTLSCSERVIASGKTGTQICADNTELCTGVFEKPGFTGYTAARCSWTATSNNYLANCCKIS